MIKRIFIAVSQKRFMMQQLRFMQTGLIILALAGLLSCATSPEVQAKMDTFARTTPTCSSDFDCQAKWTAARAWVVENSDFPIRTPNEQRISASSTLISDAGTGVIVNRVAADGGGYQIIVDVECFSAYGCPNIWDLKLDFNRAVNGER
jgi:hypothetical protein